MKGEKFRAAHTYPAHVEQPWTKLSFQLCPGFSSEDYRREQRRKLATVKDAVKEPKPWTATVSESNQDGPWNAHILPYSYSTTEK